MEDPFFGRLWDRFPQRTPRRNFYSYHPYAEANVTPTKPEHEYWGAPQLKPKTSTVPVHGPLSHASPNSSSVTKGNSSSKPTTKNVVSIPVDAEAPKSSSRIRKAAVPRMDETSAATKIQSSFRGFSARRGAPLKNLRVIRDVKAEAGDIRRRLADRRVVESILQNEKERLKITEGIMSLLLKLDAIQGVNSFVRESRKLATRELVNLQELVDAILAGKPIEGTASIGAEAEEFLSAPCTDEEVIRHFMDEEKGTNNASDCETQTCNRLKGLDLSQAEAETIQADKVQREGEGMKCEDTGEVIEAGAVVRESASVEEDNVKVRDENEKLKKTVVDLLKETKLQNKLINNLRQRVAKLEEQISKPQRKKCGDKKKKKKETSNSITGKRKTE